ncbi:MAG: helix-turn-helix domain-containing protein [Methanobacteriota archaeon]
MRELKLRIDTTTANAVRELLKSEAESRIYLYLLKKNGAKSDDITKGTKLHPSTVRELLSKMHAHHLIHREKLKNDNIGKHPYLYYAAPPRHLLRQYITEIEHKLTKIANLDTPNSTNNTRVHITIHDTDEEDA